MEYCWRRLLGTVPIKHVSVFSLSYVNVYMWCAWSYVFVFDDWFLLAWALALFLHHVPFIAVLEQYKGRICKNTSITILIKCRTWSQKNCILSKDQQKRGNELAKNGNGFKCDIILFFLSAVSTREYSYTCGWNSKAKARKWRLASFSPANEVINISLYPCMSACLCDRTHTHRKMTKKPNNNFERKQKEKIKRRAKWMMIQKNSKISLTIKR